MPGLYIHIFHRPDLTLVFVGAVAAGSTFEIFEWQAVLVERFSAERIALPSQEEQEKRGQERIVLKGDGLPFTAPYPYFEEYFEEVRALAGEVKDGTERRLPKFDPEWRRALDATHLKRITMWQESNRKAQEELACKTTRLD